jgi:hypothetical protein
VRQETEICEVEAGHQEVEMADVDVEGIEAGEKMEETAEETIPIGGVNHLAKTMRQVCVLVE